MTEADVCALAKRPHTHTDDGRIIVRDERWTVNIADDGSICGRDVELQPARHAPDRVLALFMSSKDDLEKEARRLRSKKE